MSRCWLHTPAEGWGSQWQLEDVPGQSPSSMLAPTTMAAGEEAVLAGKERHGVWGMGPIEKGGVVSNIGILEGAAILAPIRRA